MHDQSSASAGRLSSTGAVIVAHARTDLALRCCLSLNPEIPPENTVVVVNAPHQVDPLELARLEDLVRVVSPPRIQGYGANLNLGVRMLPPELEFYLLANDDLEFGADSLSGLLSVLCAEPRIGIVGPAIQTAGGRHVPGYRPFPTALASLLAVALLPLGKAWAPLTRRAGMIAANDTTDLPGDSGWIMGAAMLVRATAYASVRGLDEDFFLYFEEADFCYRLRAAGWKIGWAAHVPVIHVGGASSRDARFRRVLAQGRRTYLRKRLGRVRMVALQAAQLATFLTSCLYHGVAAVLRPASRRERVSLLRERYRTSRVFLLGPDIRA